MIASSAALHSAAIPILSLPVAMIVTFAVHEFGHVLAAAIRGQRLVLLTIGPIKVLRLGERLRIGFNSRLAYWGGMALSAPPRWRGLARHRRDSAFILAGGPFASVIFGAVVLAAAIVRGSGHARAIVQSPVSFTLLTLGAMSLGIGLVTLGPGLFTAGGRSDGARLRRELDPAVDSDVDAVVGPIIHLLRPAEWHADIPAMLEQALSTAPSVRRALLLHRWALDTRREREAVAFLDTAQRIATKSDERAACAVDAAMYAALWRGDVRGATMMLDDAGVTRDDPASLAAHAAIAWAEGRTEDAADDLRVLDHETWRTLSPGLLLTHSAAIDRMRIDEVATAPGVGG